VGAPRREAVLSAREHILAAIRAARVPASPPAAELGRLRTAHSGAPGAPPAAPSDGVPDEWRAEFLRILAEVGGVGVVRARGQSLEALLDALLGADRPDAMIVRGRFAVAENAAVYVDAADLAQRSDIVRRAHLVVVVPADAVVPTMHEAVRLMPTGAGCGWFLSGPSKTADIEQSLVFGAQGSRTHRVVLDAG
jgi:hypothetical protein